MLQEATFLFDLTEVQNNPGSSTVQRPCDNDEDGTLDKSALSSLRGTIPRRDTRLTINESDQTTTSSSRSPGKTPQGTCHPASITPSQMSRRSYRSAASLKLLHTVTERQNLSNTAVNKVQKENKKLRKLMEALATTTGVDLGTLEIEDEDEASSQEYLPTNLQFDHEETADSDNYDSDLGEGVYNADTLQNYRNEESADSLTRPSGPGQPEDASDAAALLGVAAAIP